MQQFDDKQGERRILDIKTMTPKDAEEYYMHLLEKPQNETLEELKQKIKENKKKKKDEIYEWILAIKSKKGKLIGIINVWEIGANKAYFTIDVLKDDANLDYGMKAIKQFCKICEEKQYFSTIELEKGNEVVEQYKEYYNKDSYIEVIA